MKTAKLAAKVSKRSVRGRGSLCMKNDCVAYFHHESCSQRSHSSSAASQAKPVKSRAKRAKKVRSASERKRAQRKKMTPVQNKVTAAIDNARKLPPRSGGHARTTLKVGDNVYVTPRSRRQQPKAVQGEIIALKRDWVVVDVPPTGRQKFNRFVAVTKQEI